ncbi:MAG: iron-sulfur cluster assembly scaffold protein [Candidatus Nanoarchaeia archaeon]|nr:iron-sulfur cluster assembly scaffold protein [Candidatus Nanoarchaeia archaeon]
MIKMDMYRQIIMDNYKYPKNTGKLEKFNIENKSSNISCGDEIEIFLDIQDNLIKDISYLAKGCAMSVASMSLFSDKIKGKSIEYVLNLSEEEYFELINIFPTISRVKCVLLGLKTLKEAIIQFKSQNKFN